MDFRMFPKLRGGGSGKGKNRYVLEAVVFITEKERVNSSCKSHWCSLSWFQKVEMTASAPASIRLLSHKRLLALNQSLSFLPNLCYMIIPPGAHFIFEF